MKNQKKSKLLITTLSSLSIVVPILFVNSCSNSNHEEALAYKALEQAFLKFNEGDIQVKSASIVGSSNKQILTKLPFLITKQEMTNDFFSLKNTTIVENIEPDKKFQIFLNLDSIYLDENNKLTFKLLYSTEVNSDLNVSKFFNYSIDNTIIKNNNETNETEFVFEINKEKFQFESLPKEIWELYINTYQLLYFGSQKLKSDLVINWSKLTKNTTFSKAKANSIISSSWENEYQKNKYSYEILSYDFDEYRPTREEVIIAMKPNEIFQNISIKQILKEDEENKDTIFKLKDIFSFKYKLIPNFDFAYPNSEDITLHIKQNSEIATTIDTSSQRFNPKILNPLIFEGKTMDQIIEQQNKNKNVFYPPEQFSYKVSNREISFRINEIKAAPAPRIIQISVKIIVGIGKFQSTDTTFIKFFHLDSNKFSNSFFA